MLVGLTKKCHGSPELSQLNCSAMSGRSIQPAARSSSSETTRFASELYFA